MATTIFSYALDGSNKDFPIPFEYLARKYVVVTLEGETRQPLVLNDDFRFTGANQITTNVAWGAGDGYTTIELRRVTSATERLINFSDGSILKAYDLNTSQIQAIHIAEEARDVSSVSLIHNGFTWNAGGRRMRNLGDPIDQKDAANKDYVDTTLLGAVRGAPGEQLKTLPVPSMRANKVLAFDSDGNPTVIIPQSGSATALAIDLAKPTGATMLGFVRTKITEAVLTVAGRLSVTCVNVWETQFVMLITSKPTSDPATWDWTPAIEAASTYVSSNGGGVVELTEGIFPITRIYRRNGVSIRGRGMTATYLQALPFNPGGPDPYGMIEQVAGPVIGSHISGVHLLGLPAVNVNQWGMYLHAKWDAAYQHGGLWMCIHDDMRVTYFNKGVWSRGGYTVTNYQRPQQFLEFRSVYIQVVNGGEALRLTGQHGQIKFTMGSAEGRDSNVAWRCVTIGMDPDPSTTAVNGKGGENTADLPGVGNAVQGPINVSFRDEFSVQKAQEAYNISNGKAIVISDNWSEDIGKFLDIAVNSVVTVEKNHIANSADGAKFGAAGSGYLYAVRSNSTLNWKDDNNITGTVDNITLSTVSINDAANVNVKLGSFNGDTTGKFKAAGYRTATIDVNGKITMLGHKQVSLINNTDITIPLRTISAAAAPGEIITLRAAGGPVSLMTGGNISLNGIPGITVPVSGVVQLMRIHEVGASGEWMLIQSTPHYGSNVPTSGYYMAGTVIWRSNPAVGSFSGVQCVTSGIAGTSAVFGKLPNLLP